MEIHHLGRLCLLVTALLSLDLYAKFSQISLTFIATRSSSYLFKLLSKRPVVGSTCFGQFVTGIALYLAFSVGLKVINFSFRPRSHLRHGDCLNSDLCDLMEPLGRPSLQSAEESEYSDCEESCLEDLVFDEMCLREFSMGNDICDQMELMGRPDSLFKDGHLVPNGNPQSLGGFKNPETEELSPEDRASEVKLLRELVKSERRRAEAALAELEKERSAATSAVEETLSMILRLQSEKSSIEIEAKQYRRLAEEKQRHDQEVIGSLRSVIAEQERDLNHLEGELGLCSRRLSSGSHFDCNDSTGYFEYSAEEDDVRRSDNGESVMGESFDEELEDGLISSLRV